MKPLIILAGPTAVGKTALSVTLAERIGGEIISADSMQVYRHMDIGTAKVNPGQMRGIRHHLIDVLEPTEEFNVVTFQKLAKASIQDIYERGKLPIIVGGTGFYIQALLYDVNFSENEEDNTYRRYLEELGETQGNSCLHQMLREVDPDAADTIHENNQKRVIRALEFYHLNGRRISLHNREEQERESPYTYCYFVLNDRRERIYENINHRVEQMMADGLETEMVALTRRGCTDECLSMQGLGYHEMLRYLNGEITVDEAAELVKRDTRHFAKRQLTWFRREREVIWLNKHEFGYDEEAMLNTIYRNMEAKGITALKS